MPDIPKIDIANDMQKLLYQVAGRVQKNAKDICQTGKYVYKTGNLFRDIKIYDKYVKSEAKISVGNSMLAFYAPFVHYGTKRMNSRPYFEIAFRQYSYNVGADLQSFADKVSKNFTRQIQERVRQLGGR